MVSAKFHAKSRNWAPNASAGYTETGWGDWNTFSSANQNRNLNCCLKTSQKKEEKNNFIGDEKNIPAYNTINIRKVHKVHDLVRRCLRDSSNDWTTQKQGNDCFKQAAHWNPFSPVHCGPTLGHPVTSGRHSNWIELRAICTNEVKPWLNLKCNRVCFTGSLTGQKVFNRKPWEVDFYLNAVNAGDAKLLKDARGETTKPLKGQPYPHHETAIKTRFSLDIRASRAAVALLVLAKLNGRQNLRVPGTLSGAKDQDNTNFNTHVIQHASCNSLLWSSLRFAFSTPWKVYKQADDSETRSFSVEQWSTPNRCQTTWQLDVRGLLPMERKFRALQLCNLKKQKQQKHRRCLFTCLPAFTAVGGALRISA